MRHHPNSYIRISLFLLSCIASSLSFALDGRVIHETDYKGRYGALTVKMTRQLIDLGDGKFALEARAKSFVGRVSEREEFLWQNDRIRPLSYRYRQSIFGVDRERGLDFDWNNNQVKATDRKNEKVLDIDAGTLGPMTYQLQLQRDLATDNQPLNYVFANRMRIKDYHFERHELQTYSHDRKKIEGALLVRRADGEKRTDAWFDPSEGYTLIGLSHTEDGDGHSMHFVREKKSPPFEGTPYDYLLDFDQSES